MSKKGIEINGIIREINDKHFILEIDNSEFDRIKPRKEYTYIPFKNSNGSKTMFIRYGEVAKLAKITCSSINDLMEEFLDKHVTVKVISRNVKNKIDTGFGFTHNKALQYDLMTVRRFALLRHDST